MTPEIGKEMYCRIITSKNKKDPVEIEIINFDAIIPDTLLEIRVAKILNPDTGNGPYPDLNLAMSVYEIDVNKSNIIKYIEFDRYNIF